jgi:hypothetical protein
VRSSVVDAGGGGELTLAHPTFAKLPPSQTLNTIAPAHPPLTRPNSTATPTLVGAHFVTASPTTSPAPAGLLPRYEPARKAYR